LALELPVWRKYIRKFDKIAQNYQPTARRFIHISGNIRRRQNCPRSRPTIFRLHIFGERSIPAAGSKDGWEFSAAPNLG
jgi:hypothetical protein